MVVAGKVFKLRESISLSSAAARLKDFRKEERYDEGPVHTSLLTEVHSLSLKEGLLKGVYAQDIITYVFHHGERIPTPKTLEVSFAFVEQSSRTLLVVMERKFLANNVANRLSEALFISGGYITEASILPEVLKDFHEKNPENTKIIFFDAVDIPNVSKLSLYGSGLMNTALYNNYTSHGSIWYIVVTSRKHGSIVGITRNSVVTIFNRMDKEEFLDYVSEEVFPLIL
ncbi:MAG: hypothetical protein QG670_1548 [Thermoproteota archaeon]|nr:hypothetical protein [Thermoproteota archaeon]